MIKKIQKSSFDISAREIKDLAKSWMVLALAFTIISTKSLSSFNFITLFMIFAVAVGTAFIFHELAHKVVAQHYGCQAEFRSFDKMLIFALIMSFFGFIFAAPGAVMIRGAVGIRRIGKISLAGPATNMALALIFLIINLNFNSGFVQIISFYGFMVNSWIGFFNMLPFFILDGKKILYYSKPVYGVMAIVAIIFVMLQGVVSVS